MMPNRKTTLVNSLSGQAVVDRTVVNRVLPDLPRHGGWRAIDGVILLDKPVGVTSNGALQWVRRLLAAEKGGHTGTLDPFATGVLPICLGEATKFSADLLNADKTYEATLRFGQQTDTADLTGAGIAETAVLPTVEQLEAIRSQFTGEISQIPPMYSALKRDGQPLYKLARQGVEVERAPRQITIHELAWLDFEQNAAGRVQTATLRVRCSKGTYVRTLAEDLARAAGSLAHLIALRRTQVGAVTLQGCVIPEALYQGVAALTQPVTADLLQAAGLMQPVDFLVQDLPIVELSEAQAVRCRHGNPCLAEPGQTVPAAGQCRLLVQGRFLGVGGMQPVPAQSVQSEKTLQIQPIRLVSAGKS